MRANNVLGLVFANIDDNVLSEVTGVRSMASLNHFAVQQNTAL